MHSGKISASRSGACRWVAMATLCSLLCVQVVKAVGSPRISNPIKQRQATLGQRLVIPCQAFPGFPDDFTIIYWLVNCTFIETTYPSKRIQEKQEKIYTVGGQTVIQRDLTFNWTKKKDFKSNFTCVVMNPAGMDKMQVTLVPSRSQRRHKSS
ncbi:interleukin-1 receptor type 2-like isoform X1 [Acipenser ruthenus]|uniref:interleukin-1 receptor type 2-like isoform X1 n=1 Tax=Acipenser ruthenus TaxID=7906 RepID=UPI002741A632|nr:interleukin-1 receptor type 2-like isoform X1 [Acipenser ruthenus]